MTVTKDTPAMTAMKILTIVWPILVTTASALTVLTPTLVPVTKDTPETTVTLTSTSVSATTPVPTVVAVTTPMVGTPATASPRAIPASAVWRMSMSAWIKRKPARMTGSVATRLGITAAAVGMGGAVPCATFAPPDTHFMKEPVVSGRVAYIVLTPYSGTQI